ncbi:MaoC/PaaZ C-terminal domain-containing protein [Brevibacterium sp. RIT 803]|uniref:MaoC/PaaZ C-terminal domain-containing protein n=1 Tax=Brevibacterium sp. RIT 803 TaxID=2810210 RepID=UPI0019517C3F|nr:MaoC/PaaZ C-terminal domain-containing protein [Brevibacterium sp. RIT 803]MBM6591354.1 dehydratase [Brevibacterium sp. RIT 803]
MTQDPAQFGASTGRFISTDHSLYFEDMDVGQIYRSSSRTLSETDLTLFSMVSGDWNQVHSDAEYMEAGGGRLLHGVLGIAVITGLMDRAGWFTSSAIAMTGIDDWTFKRPLYIGDTVTMEMEILGKRLVSAEDKGFLDRQFTLYNQHGEIAQQGRCGFLIKRRDESAVNAQDW